MVKSVLKITGGTTLAQLPVLAINSKLAKQLACAADTEVSVKQTHSQGKFKLAICDDIADNVVLLARNAATVGFAGGFDAIELSSSERV